MIIKKYNDTRLNALSISDVASQLGEIKRQGNHYVTLCPWHNDTHPSLVLNEGTSDNYCHCFSCGHGGSVIDLTMAKLKVDFKEACQWLSDKYSIPLLDGTEAQSNLVVPKVDIGKKELKPLAYIPIEYVRSTVSMANSLSVCIAQLFGYDAAKHVTNDYLLGIHRNYFHRDATIFWTIDTEGHVHNGKVQQYVTDPHSPRYAHSLDFNLPDGRTMKSYWMTNELTKLGFVPEGHRLDIDGLFGAHLLSLSPVEQQIILVESPKNAVIGAAAFPDYLWLASGSKSMLKQETLTCLKGRYGKIYPDRDAISEWTHTIHSIDCMKDFSVRDFCETQAPSDDKKYDIADYIIESMRNSKN